MKFPALFFVFFLSVSLAGCSHQYVAQTTDHVARTSGMKAQYQVERFRNIAVRSNNSICLAPVPLADESLQQQLLQSWHVALQTRFVDVSMLMEVQDANAALREAWRQGCDLLFYPTLLLREDNTWSFADWNDEATEQSGYGMDKLQLGISLWDVNGAQVIDKAVIMGRSAWLDLHSSSSADLIDGSIDRYLQRLVAVH